MAENELKRHTGAYNDLMYIVIDMAQQMKSDRNDGWTKEHYRNSLTTLKDYLDKVLEQ